MLSEEEVGRVRNLRRKATHHSPGIRARVLGLLCAWSLRLLSATWRVEIVGLQQLDAMLDLNERILLTFWHGKYLPLFTLLRGRKALVFTTDSLRGRVIREICLHFGYTCSLLPRYKEREIYTLDFMQAELTSQNIAVLAVDGPLGPFHVVKPGVIKLASTLEFILVPMSTASRHKHIMARRWDHLELPVLFTQVTVFIGEPLQVPVNLNQKDIPIWEDKLREALEVLDSRVNDRGQ
jgi:lysophospholipid acyltransferase (LPLAT)-like uncharacterized protein